MVICSIHGYPMVGFYFTTPVLFQNFNVDFDTFFSDYFMHSNCVKLSQCSDVFTVTSYLKSLTSLVNSFVHTFCMFETFELK